VSHHLSSDAASKWHNWLRIRRRSARTSAIRANVSARIERIAAPRAPSNHSHDGLRDADLDPAMFALSDSGRSQAAPGSGSTETPPT
jgi:hypothetical protein